jgi:Ca2+-binding RTX toxin-like protein
MAMNLLKRLPILLAVIALLAAVVGGSALAATSRQCQGGVDDPDYCASNANNQDPPPAGAPAPQPPQEGQPTTVAGTLTGGTVVVEAPNSGNAGEIEVAVNVAGVGTLIINVGLETIVVTVAPDGTTTITPEHGDPIVVSGPGHTTPGIIVITISSDGTTTYALKTPGTKTVKIGNSSAKVPGTATISKSADSASYRLNGSGSCTATLDPALETTFNSAEDIQCTIESPGGSSSRRALPRVSARSFRDTIRTGRLADRISAGPGKDLVNAGGGNDLIRGDHSLASMKLGANARRAYAATVSRVSGADSLFGSDGNDRIFGDGGNDSLYGGDGNDRLRGNLGNDGISGGGGDDRIDGGAGRDRIRAGNGNDKIRARGNGLDTIDCGSGRDEVWVGDRDRVFSNCETVHRFG